MKTHLALITMLVFFASFLSAQNSEPISTKDFFKSLESHSWIGEMSHETCVFTILEISEIKEGENDWHNVTFSLHTNDKEIILDGLISRFMEDEFQISISAFEEESLGFFTEEYDGKWLYFNGALNAELWGGWIWGENDMEAGEDVSLHYYAKCPGYTNQDELPIIHSQGIEGKYLDWGPEPEETDYGPEEKWTQTHMMCWSPDADTVVASSSLASQGQNTYGIENIMDDNPNTAWVEGAADYGIGEYFEFENVHLMGDGIINILNGYQRSQATWEANSRVKRMLITIEGREICYVDLEDKMGAQSFQIPECALNELRLITSEGGKIVMRFTIIDVFQGTKYKDTCISGIFNCGG